VQRDRARVRAIYLETVNMTSSANAPVYVSVAFYAPEIVSVLLGAGWERSGVILQVLAIWGGLRSTCNPVGSLSLGMGRAELLLLWNLALLLLGTPAIWLGSTYGPEGIATALLSIAVLLFVPGVWLVLVRPLCNVGFLEYSRIALRPFGLAVIAAASGY